MKKLKIVGVKTVWKVKNCRQCPCFDDAGGFEYVARCMLTGEDGDNLRYEDTVDSEMILRDCPLPNWKKKDEENAKKDMSGM